MVGCTSDLMQINVGLSGLRIYWTTNKIFESEEYGFEKKNKIVMIRPIHKSKKIFNLQKKFEMFFSVFAFTVSCVN